MTDARKRVLVADDDEAGRYMVESLLQGGGYEVVTAADGEEALVRAREIPVDLLVTDILMPRMDGYRLLQEWKADAALAEAPVIVYTATYTAPGDERLASDMGADRFVSKPQEPDVLLGIVAEVLASRRRGKRPAAAAVGETEVLREYSERLVHKLEEKVAELDGANTDLRRAIDVLSDEIGVKNQLIDRLNEDLGERDDAEGGLREANESLAAVIASSPLPIVGLDQDACITMWNPAAERVFGWTAAEVLGKRNPAVPADVQDEQLTLLEQTLRGEPVTGYETERVTKDGRRLVVALFTSRLDEGEGPHEYVGIFEDVTERRRVEQLRSDFLATVGHELRTPLTGILGFSDLLRSAAQSRADCTELAERIHGKAVELDGLVEQLLEAASIQAGYTAISRIPTDVGLFLEIGMKAICVPEGFTLELDVEQGLPEVRIDRERLGRAIDALVSNAFKYSPEGGRVHVWASRKGDTLQIGVSDEGVGVSAENAPRIFEPFTQADMSTTREFGGMGLGLYTARRVVEAHGGSIRLDTTPGEGATFVIELPLA